MKNNINEFLFSLYLGLFIFSKLFISIFPNYSFYILMIPCLLILFTSLLITILKTNKTVTVKIPFLIIIFTVISLFLFSLLFNPNNYIGTYFYEFIIYGIITLYLFSKVKNFHMVIYYSSIFSVINFILYFSDPFNNYYIYGDYMGFGLNCMLPIFCFSCVARKMYHNKLFLIIEILSLIELLFFSNRGAFFTAIILEIIFIIVNEDIKRNKMIILKYFILFFILFLVVINIDKILLLIINFLEKIKFNSYSLKAFYQMVFEQNSGLSGRDVIWGNAISYFKNSIIFGHGIGSFESVYGVYAHNLIFEILTSYGIVGGAFFLISVIKYVYNIFKSSGKLKYILMLFFTLGLVPLMFSIYTFRWPYYWIYLYLSIAKISCFKIDIERSGN